MPAHAPKLRLSTRTYIVIPARLASTRLHRKLLLRETGKTVIQHTFEAASRATKPLGIFIATDHEEIVTEARGFGGRAVRTDPDAASGTDRVAEVAREIPDADVIVNVQGDEPEIEASAIDLVVTLLEENPGASMATIATPIRSRDKLEDPACVKVVFDEQGRALYFSRSPIPHPREWDDTLLEMSPARFHQHVGIYAYRRDFLLKFAGLPTSMLERTEKLEQLRALETGHSILVGVVPKAAVGIDTAEDYRAFVSRARSW